MDLNELRFPEVESEEMADQVFAMMAELVSYKEMLKEQAKLCEKKYKQGEEVILNYFKSQLENDPDFKMQTMFGNISKQNGKTWIYEDEDLIIKQLEELAPSLVETVTTKKYNKNNFKKLVEVTDDGDILLNDEVLEGVRVEEEQKISVKIK